MALLTREQILNAQDIRQETVNVPEWGGEVIVQTPTAEQTTALMGQVAAGGEDDRPDEQAIRQIMGRLVAMCCVNEDGEAIFTEDDVAALNRKSAAALKRVFTVCQRLSGIGDDEIEELAGNS